MTRSVSHIHNSVDFLYQVTDAVNERFAQIEKEALLTGPHVPRVTPGQVRVIIDVYREMMTKYETSEPPT